MTDEQDVSSPPSRASWSAGRWVLALVVGLGTLGWASPAWAHGVGTREELPLPVTQVAWAGGIALAVSAIALFWFWPTPRLAHLAHGRVLSPVADRVLDAAGTAGRVVALALFGLVGWAAFAGPDDQTINLAPVALFVAFWVGMQVVSATFGDVWATVNPFDTIAAGIEPVRDQFARPATFDPARFTHWPAAAGLAGFLWLELAYHAPASPRAVGWFIVAYSAAMMVGVLRYGRVWLRTGDGFAVLFALLAAMAPLARDDDGRLKARWPFSGLSEVSVRPGTLAVVLVTIGATGFDGLSRTRTWADIIEGYDGWSLTLLQSFGMAWMIGIVWVSYSGAARWAGRAVRRAHTDIEDQFINSMIPIMLAYTIAHYFSLFIVEGQTFVILVSDPAAMGWNLLGTATAVVDPAIVAAGTVAWIQAMSICIGHIVAVVVGHDRAVELFDPNTAILSQVPFVAVMVLYTVGGLLLLVGL